MRAPQDAEKATITRDLLLDSTGTHEAFPAYFKLYESIFCPAENHNTIIQIDNPAFESHADILECARTLRANPTLTHEQLTSYLSSSRAISQTDCRNAIQSVVRVAFMLDCSVRDKYSPNYEVSGYSHARWEAREPFASYVERAVPRHTPDQGSGFDPNRHRNALKAWKLKKRCRLQFLPTDNIMEHLLYDPKTQIVQVFHHTGYLKSHLRRSQDQAFDQEVLGSLKLGMLPPQLLLETLHTIQFILFPISSDKGGKSTRMLKALMRKHGFDPNARVDEGLIRKDVPPKFKYEYWAHRLKILYHLAKSPPPRNWVVSWIERHTSERNALTVAIVGLFLSAFFGLLTCLIGGAQLYIAIVAWKDPREPS
ncbi:hypothetical protein BJX65DRAFT_320303 [Aspergillus insuetus]